MNIASQYRWARRRKRTYWIIGVTAVLLVLSAVFGIGVYEAIEYENELTHQQETTVPYEETFRNCAEKIHWEWQLLAALAWTESHWNPRAVSYCGARGVMQLMPVTGARFGLNDSTVWIPEHNIVAGTKYIQRLQQQFVFIKDSTEQAKFVIASYNAGPAHIHDARRLAKKYGESPYSWAATEKYLELLRYEEYYTDSLVQYGPFNSDETIGHVRKVYQTCRRIKEKEKVTNTQIL